MQTKIGAWATITDGDAIEWTLCGDWTEFHVGQLDLTVSAKALAAWMTAAQSAQRQLLASARQRHPSAATDPAAASKNSLPQVRG